MTAVEVTRRMVRLLLREWVNVFSLVAILALLAFGLSMSAMPFVKHYAASLPRTEFATRLGMGVVASMIPFLACWQGALFRLLRDAGREQRQSVFYYLRESGRDLPRQLPIVIGALPFLLIGYGLFLVPGYLMTFVITFAMGARALDGQSFLGAWATAWRVTKEHARTLVRFSLVTVGPLLLLAIAHRLLLPISDREGWSGATGFLIVQRLGFIRLPINLLISLFPVALYVEHRKRLPTVNNDNRGTVSLAAQPAVR